MITYVIILISGILPIVFWGYFNMQAHKGICSWNISIIKSLNHLYVHWKLNFVLPATSWRFTLMYWQHDRLIDDNTSGLHILKGSSADLDVKVASLVDDSKKLENVTSSETSVSIPNILERIRRSHNLLAKVISSFSTPIEDLSFLKRFIDHVIPNSSNFITDCKN